MNSISTSSKCLLAFLSLAVSFPMDSRAESETVVFKTASDGGLMLGDFFKPKQPASWTVEEGAIISQGNGVTFAGAKSPASPDCKVEVDVTLLEDVEEGGFAGVPLGGVIFHVRPDGFRYAYHTQVDEKEKSGQQNQIIEYGQAYHWEITRKTLEGGSCAFQWSVDGEVVAEFVVRDPLEGNPESLGLIANRIKTRFENVALYQLPASE